jgi:hypothetical protein
MAEKIPITDQVIVQARAEFLEGILQDYKTPYMYGEPDYTPPQVPDRWSYFHVLDRLEAPIKEGIAELEQQLAIIRA